MLKPETISLQHAIADYCKDIPNISITDVNTERLNHYKRLIFNIISDALETTYPITLQFIKRSQWDEMVKDFVQNHHCKHSQLFRMPGEFIHFVEKWHFQEQFQIPYLINLLQFEWVEVLAHTMKDVEIPKFDTKGDLWEEKLVFNPYLIFLELDYPIHRLNELKIEDYKSNYYLLIYREPNGTVQYTEMNQLTYQMLQHMKESNLSLQFVLNEFISQLPVDLQRKYASQSLQFFERLKSLGVILGTAC